MSEFASAPVSSETDVALAAQLHQQHFGSTFDILTQSGDAAHTACLGFVLERVTMALFKHHGFDPDRWPSAVRQRLWP